MSAGRQMVFDLPARPALGRDDFFVSPANRLALAQVDAWPAWPDRRLAICGPGGSGKTHIVHVWAARAGARILPAAALRSLDLARLPEGVALAIEDFDRSGDHGRAEAEEALFHLMNHLAASGGSLMLTGRVPPAQWDVALPDLSSRLGAAQIARLDPPDDALLSAVLVKLFSDRQIDVGPDLIAYLLARMDRSFEAAETLVMRLDVAGLARQRPITPRLAGEVL